MELNWQIDVRSQKPEVYFFKKLRMKMAVHPSDCQKRKKYVTHYSEQASEVKLGVPLSLLIASVIPPFIFTIQRILRRGVKKTSNTALRGRGQRLSCLLPLSTPKATIDFSAKKGRASSPPLAAPELSRTIKEGQRDPGSQGEF